MRWLVLVLALAGAAGSGLTAYAVYTNVEDPKKSTLYVHSRIGLKDGKFPVDILLAAAAMNQEPAKIAKELVTEENQLYSVLLFAALGVLYCLFGGIVAIPRRKWSAFLLLATAPVGPMVFNPKTGIFVGVAFLAALCALLIGQPKPPAAADEDLEEARDEE
jgi:hypothetical protein